MCCEGPSPQHKKVIVAGACLFPLEFIQWILNIVIVFVWAGLAVGTAGTTINNGSNNNNPFGGRMLSPMISALVGPEHVPAFEGALALPLTLPSGSPAHSFENAVVRPASRALQVGSFCSYGAECGDADLGLGCVNDICTPIGCVIGPVGDAWCQSFLNQQNSILVCRAQAGIATGGTCQYNLPEACTKLSIDFNSQNGELNQAPTLSNDQITADITGLAVAAWLSTVLNFLMVVGLSAILCCCNCARTNAGSCWWWYLTIISTLAALIIIYPAVIMAGLTSKFGNAKACISGLVELGGSNVAADVTSVVDTIHTVITVVTIMIFLTLILRGAVAVLLWFCTPSAEKLAQQQGYGAGGGNVQMAQNVAYGAPIVQAGV